MDVIGRGIIAGFLATLLLSGVFDPVATVARTADVLPPMFGWLLHLLVGSLIWGVAFALVHPLLRGPFWLRGVLFGIGTWLLVMVAVMPLTRGGLFGLALGVGSPAVMLVIHLVYGALLGAIFGVLQPPSQNGREHLPIQSGDEESLTPLPR
ncbi:MAG TPA: DUF6789 family protein [Xanthobacteraceae bacterium]|nr:DUF6789 family protein [Xanthobacteraceae bacterium]